MTMDTLNVYLMTQLARPEYIRVKLSDIPDEIITEYNLKAKATKDGSVYIVVNRGMYGLPQSGLLANKHLEKTPEQAGLSPEQTCPWVMEARLAPSAVHSGS